MHHVTGDQLGDVHLDGLAAAHRHHRVPDGGVQRFSGSLGAVFVGEPQAHAHREDQPDDH
jgi:hypothetical protein